MKEPYRTCIGCGLKKPKDELIRIWADQEGKTRVSDGRLKAKNSGRGSYICSSLECIETARRKNRIPKNPGIEINQDVYSELVKIESGGE